MGARFTCRIVWLAACVLGLLAVCAVVRPPSAKGQDRTLDFETGDVRGWKISGESFRCQPSHGNNLAALRREQPFQSQGRFWVSTFGCYAGQQAGDELRGTGTYGPFPVPRGTLSFLIGGSSSPDTRVELLVMNDDARAPTGVLHATGQGVETMQRITWDLNPYAGRRGWIRIVDGSSGRGAHLNVDDFRFVAEGQAERRVPIRPIRPLQPEILRPFVNPRPTLRSISPDTVDAGSPDTILTVMGANFTSQSKVHMGDASLETNFVSSTQLTAVAPATQLATAGSYQVTVATPSPGGGISDAEFLTARVVVAVSPSAPTVQVTQTQPFTATVTGSANQGVSWSVNDAAGGSSLGTIDPNGIYTAPAIPPPPTRSH